MTGSLPKVRHVSPPNEGEGGRDSAASFAPTTPAIGWTVVNSREPRELELLYRLSQTLGESLDLRDVTRPALETLAEHLNLKHGTITLLNRKTGEIRIEVAHGLSGEQIAEARYRLGEGVTGQVIETGSLIAQAVKLRRTAEEEREQLEEENERLRAQLRDRFRPANIVGNSHEMQEVYDQIATVSSSNTSVLITGDTGTGKELVAQAIHYNSARSDRPFVKVHCAALPDGVIESELFGHERGAFTGAIQQRKGRFELAHTGTIFLDEVGDVPLLIQIKMLRVLQEREFERVGGTRTLRADVRIIAATNKDLSAMTVNGAFREDLFYRLNVFPIHVPPLRKRKSDIVQLADFFLERYARVNGGNVRRLSSAVIDMLMSYHWPGNVRELESCIERAVLVAKDDVVHPHHLPPTLQTAESSGTEPPGSFRYLVENYERDLLRDALKSSRGNIAAASRKLGTTPRITGYKIKKYGIDPNRYAG